MDSEKMGSDLLKSIKDTSSSATKLAVVLFAALIVSWIGLSNEVNKYKGALASRQWLEHKQLIVQTAERQILVERVRGSLISQAYQLDDVEKNKELKAFAEKLPRDPHDALRHLPAGDWKAPYLSAVIQQEESLLAKERQYGLGRYQIKKASAERTPFKLLGLDFSVDGFWAWIVWLLFFIGGTLYLSLIRKSLIVRCDDAGRLVNASQILSKPETPKLAEPLPLWMRPLPKNPDWPPLLANAASVDAAMDPLGTLCVILLAVCSLMGWLAFRMAVVSTHLISVKEGFRLEPALHAVTLCFLVGIAIVVIADWIIPQRVFTALKSWLQFILHTSRVARQDGDASSTIIGRRFLIAGLAASVGTGLAYLHPINRWVLHSMLRGGRTRYPSTKVGRKRRLRVIIPELKSGFYTYQSYIHYVPENGRTRSLNRADVTQVAPWIGEFEEAELTRVHRSALVPFCRYAVRHLLRGITHLPTPEQKKALLMKSEVRARFQAAFRLLEYAIRRDLDFQQPGRMPNLELYSLLSTVAESANSAAMIQRAKELRASATIPGIEKPRAKPKPVSPEAKVKHSRHSHKSIMPNSLDRRVQRLLAFKGVYATNPIQLGKPAMKQPESLGVPGWVPSDFSDKDSDFGNNVHVARRRSKQREHHRSHRFRTWDSNEGFQKTYNKLSYNGSQAGEDLLALRNLPQIR